MSDQTMTEAALRFPPQPGDVIADTVARSNRMAFRAGADWQASRPTPPSGLDRATIEACAKVAERIGDIFEKDDHRRESDASATVAAAIRSLAEPTSEPRKDGESGGKCPICGATPHIGPDELDHAVVDENGSRLMTTAEMVESHRVFDDAPTPPEPGSERVAEDEPIDFGETSTRAAERILTRLGYPFEPSRDPGIDRRRDDVAKLVEAAIARELRQRRAAEAEPRTYPGNRTRQEWEDGPAKSSYAAAAHLPED